MVVEKVIQRAKLEHASRWINDDIRPIEAQRRTWTFATYQNLWLLVNCNISTYLTGSALIPLGLTWWQAIICIVIGNLLAAVAVVFNSMAGAHYGIGFPVVSRVVWGMWGSYFTIWNRVFLSLIWYGFQAWVGGECVYVMLLSWDPALEEHIPNHMPESTGMTTAYFVSYIIFSIISLPVIWIRPHRLEKFFWFACSITIIFFLVFLIWALATMGSSGFGNTLANETALPATGGPDSVAWLMVYGVISTIGSIATAILNQNDYARFTKAPKHAIWGQAVSFPFYGIVCSTIGILVTAATQQRFGGEALWNPPDVLIALMQLDDNGHGSKTRVACFFAALCLVISQVGVNVPGNVLSGGFDMAACFPTFFNIRRGAYIIAILSPIVNPWKLVNTSTTFLIVLSGYSVFIGPMTGLMISSYFYVNRQKLNTDDLFKGNYDSIYWYSKGLNWRAPVAWLVGVLPLMPGFVAAVNTSINVSDGWTEIYYLSYAYGLLSSALVYALLHTVFPSRTTVAWIGNSPPSKILRADSQEKWDNLFLENGENVEREFAAPEVKGFE